MKGKHIQNESDQLWINQLTKEVDEVIEQEKSNWVLYLITKFIFYLFFSVLFYLMLFFTESEAFFVGSFVLYGIFVFLLALNFAHDCAHDSLFRSQKLNKSVFFFLFSLLGADAGAWRGRHLKAHHFAPNVSGYDSDLSVTILFRITPDSPYKKYHQWQFIYAPILYSTYSFFWIFLKDFTLLFRERKQRKWTQILSFGITKTLYFFFSLGLPLFFAKVSFFLVLIGYLAMHLTQSLFLLFTFLISHHVEGTEYPRINKKEQIEVSWIRNQVTSSNDVHPFSWLANFIFGGFNNHVAHHLFPSTHHFYYRKMNKVIYRRIQEKQWPISKTTFMGGIASHIRLLWDLGKKTNSDK